MPWLYGNFTQHFCLRLRRCLLVLMLLCSSGAVFCALPRAKVDAVAKQNYQDAGVDDGLG